MQDHHLWLIAGIALCIVEMTTGTFFMLVIGIAAFAGAGTAWARYDFWTQALVAAAVATGGVLWVNAHRRKSPGTPLPALDLGQTATFERWVSQGQGMARVTYRGTSWEARLAEGLDPAPGTVLYIRAMDGNVLHVSDQPPSKE